MKNRFDLRLDTLRGDVFGGVTAAIVALPLALAFGVASGAGPIAGIYGAIFVGFFAALIGGTPSQISGPTGPMTVVMASIFISYGDAPGLAVTVIILAGLLQILFGAIRLGDLISMVPFTVISGFMSGIGLIIIVLQLGPFLGHAASTGGVIANLAELPVFVSNIRWDAVLVGLLVLATVWLMPARINRILPAPLVALILGSLLVYFALPGVQVLGEIPTGLPSLSVPVFKLEELPGIAGWALTLALLGSIDSLLTSLIADSVTRTHHRSNRELIGQGIGNIAAGIFGGIPGAGATMRTLVNVRAGGSTRLSGVIHALLLLAVVLGLGPLASHIPNVVLAGILIKVGVDIIDWRYLTKISRAPRSGVVIMVTVLILTVFVDLIVAFATGMILASLLFVKRMSELQLNSIRAADGNEIKLEASEQILLEQHRDRIALFEFGGPMSFGAAKDIARRVVPDEQHQILILDFRLVPTFDTTAAFAIETITTNANDQNVRVILSGLTTDAQSVLERLSIIGGGNEVVLAESRAQALHIAAQCLADCSRHPTQVIETCKSVASVQSQHPIRNDPRGT